ATLLEREAAPSNNEPVFAPDIGPDGQPTPLGVRRVVWRPADEPPVEEWRAEGMVEADPGHAHTVTIPLVDVPLPSSPDPEEAEAPVDDPVADAPLPTRVPGHHMSHEPSVGSDDQTSEDDPLRP